MYKNFEALCRYIKVLPRHSPEETEENCEYSHSAWSVPAEARSDRPPEYDSSAWRPKILLI
jgi:hypothetical protein